MKCSLGKYYCVAAITIFTTLRSVRANAESASPNEHKSILFQNIIPSYIQSIITSEELGQLAEEDLYDGLSQDCRVHLQEWIHQLKTLKLNSDLWALQMIDAWAKFPEGVFSGHTVALGDFDECLQIRANVNISGKVSNFKGRFCHSVLTTNMTDLEIVPSQFEVGTCYPSSCSREDVNTFQMNAVGFVQLPIKSAELNSCYTDDKPVLTAGDIVMIIIPGVLACLCIVGTLVDVIYIKRNLEPSKNLKFPVQFVVAFSLYTNTRKWASTTVTKDDIGCVHGIRFLTTSWIILLHTWSMIYQIVQPSWNSLETSRVHEGRWTIISVLNGTLAVDTFFAIGGFLVSYNLLKVLGKTGRLNVPMLYLHRYVRLTPVYAVVVGILATWFSYIGSGPNWSGIEMWAESCRKNWWHNLLYINNLLNYSMVGDDNMCSGDSWYLPADMQYFLVSPFLIYSLFKWRRIGLFLMTITTLASIVVPAVITYQFDLMPTFMPYISADQAIDYTRYAYMKPYTRFGPYMVGLWTGYLLIEIRKRDSKVRLSRPVILAGWCISTATALAVVFGLLPYYDFGSDIPTISSALYAGLHRFVWGIVICWIIMACTFGHGGWINMFLSWKAFIPLGRLSFCVYLISYKLQLLFHRSVRQAVSYNVYTTTNIFFSHVVMSYLVAFVFFITIETPFLSLDKLIFQGASEPPKRKDMDSEIRNNVNAST